MTDINRALVVEWAMRQLGKAVLAAVLVAVVGAYIAAMSGDGGLWWIPALGGPLAFGLTLYTARVPAPGAEDALEETERQLRSS